MHCKPQWDLAGCWSFKCSSEFKPGPLDPLLCVGVKGDGLMFVGTKICLWSSPGKTRLMSLSPHSPGLILRAEEEVPRDVLWIFRFYRQLSVVCFWEIRWRHKKKSNGTGFTYVHLQPEGKGSILNSFCCRSLTQQLLQAPAWMLLLVHPSSASAASILSSWKSAISCSHRLTPYLPFAFMVPQNCREGLHSWALLLLAKTFMKQLKQSNSWRRAKHFWGWKKLQVEKWKSPQQPELAPPILHLPTSLPTHTARSFRGSKSTSNLWHKSTTLHRWSLLIFYRNLKKDDLEFVGFTQFRQACFYF